MNKPWTVQAAFEWIEGYLTQKDDENPRVSTQWLLSKVTGLSRLELYTHFDQPLSMPERDILREYVARRGRGEPLQYITGEVGFRHLTVKVRPGVLIPRPETEVLVSEALTVLDSFCAHAREDFSQEEDATDAKEPGDKAVVSPLFVVDLCTGSGCIACAIAQERCFTQVVGTDCAPEAVALAQSNAEALKLSDRATFLECDLGEGVAEELLGKVALVVSNPPYIPTDILKEIPSEVSDFEPLLALDGGADGLDFFRRIVVWSLRALAPGGALVVELHETTLEEAAHIASKSGFTNVEIKPDLTGRNRILVATTAPCV